MSAPENPFAFPMQPSNADEMMHPEYGMTLRDHFAGQAIGAVIRQCANDGQLGFPEGVESLEALFARNSYRIADAMLAERMKRGVA